MNRSAKLLLILTISLTFAYGCKNAGSKNAGPAEVTASEKADSKPAETVKTGKLMLNNETYGSLEDPGALNEMINKIMKDRETHGVFREKSNALASDIYLVADPKISLGKIAGLTFNNAELWFPRGKPINESDLSARPNPLMLLIRTENSPKDWYPSGTTTDEQLDQVACRAEFRVAESRKGLASLRALENSLEISSDDKFFINRKTGKDQKGADDLTPDQRTISDSELGPALANLYEDVKDPLQGDRGKFKLKVIVSENASYASLLKLLAAIDKANVLLDVTVRPIAYQEKGP